MENVNDLKEKLFNKKTNGYDNLTKEQIEIDNIDNGNIVKNESSNIQKKMDNIVEFYDPEKYDDKFIQ